MALTRKTSCFTLFFAALLGYWIVLFVNQDLFIKKYSKVVRIYDLDENLIPNTNINSTVLKHYGNGTTLYQKVRVLCWVLTSPSNHETKAKAVKETWGPHCNVLLFMSTVLDPTLPTVQLPTYEGRNQLWGKTREAFRYIWENHRDEADWFLKADDDTFVVVENLRYFLSGFNTSKPMWFGHKFKPHTKNGYFSGGAGYVLSKEAVKVFVEEGYFNGLVCKYDHTGAEDAEMGKCLESLNVTAMDSRDSKGRGRFFPFAPESHYDISKPDDSYWYWKYIYYPPKMGRDCCSDGTVSFHYITPEKMRVLYYLIYKLKPYGREIDQRPSTPEPPPDFNLTATPWNPPAAPTTPTTTQMPTTTSSTTTQIPSITSSATSQVTSTTSSTTSQNPLINLTTQNLRDPPNSISSLEDVKIHALLDNSIATIIDGTANNSKDRASTIEDVRQILLHRIG